MKTMRLVDANPILADILDQMERAKRKGDDRAHAALGYVFNCIGDAPTVPLSVSEGDAEGERKAVRHKYGEYQNVLLSDAEMEKLRAEFPDDLDSRIEAVSEYVASSGKKYKSFLAVIRNWARRDAPEEKPAAESSFETDAFFAAALKRTYGDL